MFEIIPRLFLGDVEDARHEWMNYTHVMNCTVETPFYTSKGLRIPLKDIPTEQHCMLDQLPHAMLYIDYVLSKTDSKLLVHCFMGRQRSAAIVAAYLLWKNYASSAEHAIEMIRDKKKDAFHKHITFLPALLRWHSSMKCGKYEHQRSTTERIALISSNRPCS